MIESFIATINPESSVIEDWSTHVQQTMKNELEDIIKKEKLKPEKTRKFVENAFRDGQLRTTGTDLDAILPAVSIFNKSGPSRAQKRRNVIDLLKAFFQKFLGVV